MCTQANPCSLDDAVEHSSVQNGDEIIVMAGTYDDLTGDTLSIDNQINLHGAAGGPRPVIRENGIPDTLFAFEVSNTTIADLEIENTGTSGSAMAVLGVANVVIERVVATAADNAAFGCGVHSVLIRDSVCRNTHTSAPAPAAGVSTGISNTVALRNVTVVSPQNAIDVRASGSGVNVTWDLKNVIARGGTNDVVASQGTGATVAVNLAYSNYMNESPSGGATITPSTAPTNQEAAPVFVNAAGGNFHQQPSSPTIDFGGPDMLGATDFDGEPRTLDGNCDGTVLPDIGADEFNANCPAPPPEPEPQPESDTAAPDTTITKGPKDKTKKKTATFEFTGTDARAVASFQCKLDAAAFAPCTSPHTVKVKKGKHTFQVRAIDQAGNIGSPATDTWKRKKNRKR
jgi:hypothetical protein